MIEVTTTLNGNSLMVFYDGKLAFNETVDWYRSYAFDCEHIPESASKDYLRYAEAMGWR